MLVGHWLSTDPPEVKVYFLRARQCEVHVHAVPPPPRRRKLRIVARIVLEESPVFCSPYLPLCSLRMRRRETRCETHANSLRTASFTVKVFDYYNAIASCLDLHNSRLYFYFSRITNDAWNAIWFFKICSSTQVDLRK